MVAVKTDFIGRDGFNWWVGEVEDIMGAVKFLAADVSAMVTGSSILIDGGWTAG